MKLRYKEDPREWRKSVWLSALGLTIVSTLLHWRRILPSAGWICVVVVLLVFAAGAWLQPQWFRAYYRFSTWLGFHVAQAMGYVVLTASFLFIVTPLGLLLRLFGKDLLCLHRRPDAESYWSESRKATSLERLF